MKATIVVPTIREDCIRKFLEAWEPEFRAHHVIVVEDNAKKSFRLPDWVWHVSWEEIKSDLREKAWIIPRRSGAIRNYGMLLAADFPKRDMIVLLDDDCLPASGNSLLSEHWMALRSKGSVLPIFDTMFPMEFSVLGVRPRGYPKDKGPAITMLNHGLWNGVPDLDGETQLKHPVRCVQWPPHSVQIPIGIQFPMSAMNVAFRPELLPAMYQLPMGQAQPFHRFDDIWCGLIMKKACDAMGWSVRSGSPFIHHTRASDAKRNAELEAPGIIENEKIWREIAAMNTIDDSLDECVGSIHANLALLGTYWELASYASSLWRGLIAERKAS
jgi:hypothetical protein